MFQIHLILWLLANISLVHTHPYAVASKQGISKRRTFSMTMLNWIFLFSSPRNAMLVKAIIK